MKINNFWITFLIIACCCSCFRERNEVIQKDAIAGIKFTGNLQNAVFSAIRDGKNVYQGQKVESNKYYTLAAGSYNIFVTKKGKEIVRRIIFVTDGQIFEVYVP